MDAGGVENRPAAAPVIVGRIAGQHGVQGWIKVYSYTRPAEQILKYAQWMLADRRDAGHWQPVRVACVRRQAKKLLAKLDGMDDRDAAQRATGKWVAIRRAQFARLPQGEYYWHDLIGLRVVNQDGVELGIVDHLVETGANDILAVRREPAAGHAPGGADEQFLPWSRDVIAGVDIAGGCLRVVWHPDD